MTCHQECIDWSLLEFRFGCLQHLDHPRYSNKLTTHSDDHVLLLIIREDSMGSAASLRERIVKRFSSHIRSYSGYAHSINAARKRFACGKGVPGFLFHTSPSLSVFLSWSSFSREFQI